jgi:hypothetical protein
MSKRSAGSSEPSVSRSVSVPGWTVRNPGPRPGTMTATTTFTRLGVSNTIPSSAGSPPVTRTRSPMAGLSTTRAYRARGARLRIALHHPDRPALGGTNLAASTVDRSRTRATNRGEPHGTWQRRWRAADTSAPRCIISMSTRPILTPSESPMHWRGFLSRGAIRTTPAGGPSARSLSILPPTRHGRSARDAPYRWSPTI